MNLKKYSHLPVKRKLVDITQCPCCADLHLEVVATKRFNEYDIACHIGLLESGDILRYTLCKKCGFVFSNPRYSPETLSSYYRSVCPANEVFWTPKDHGTNSIYIKRQEERFNRIFSLLKRFTGDLASIADIGGKDGASLVPFVKVGSAAFVIDPGCKPEKLANKRVVGYKSMDEFLRSGEKVNCIMSLQTLEHICEPVSFLLSALSALDNGGTILIEVPYDLSWINFMFQKEINLLEELHAEHINFFSIHSLNHLTSQLGIVPVKIFTGLQLAEYGGMIPSITMIAKKVPQTSVKTLPQEFKKPVELKDLQREVYCQALSLKLRRKYRQIDCKLRGLDI